MIWNQRRSRDDECVSRLALSRSISHSWAPPSEFASWLVKGSAAVAKAIGERASDTLGDLGLGSHGPASSALRYSYAERLISIGDVHGDVDALKSVLRLANLIGPDDSWSGGRSTLVQVGDQLDRGDSELAILGLLFNLQDQARAQGGRVHILLGNHELMNAEHDFRYVTPGGFAEFSREHPSNPSSKPSDLSRESTSGALSGSLGDGGSGSGGGSPAVTVAPNSVLESVRNMPAWMRARALAMRPGGRVSGILAQRATVAIIVGDNIFVHGGLRPDHIPDGDASLEAMNSATRAWLAGKGEKPAVMKGGRSPVWMRNYSRPIPTPVDCAMLERTLRVVRAKRMIVGHTPQAAGINAACSGKIWRIDTGMSAAYGGVPEALEITPNRIRILTPKGARSSASRTRR